MVYRYGSRAAQIVMRSRVVFCVSLLLWKSGRDRYNKEKSGENDRSVELEGMCRETPGNHEQERGNGMRKGSVYAACGLSRGVIVLAAAAVFSVNVRAPVKTVAASDPDAGSGEKFAMVSEAEMPGGETSATVSGEEIRDGQKIATSSDACKWDGEERVTISGAYGQNSTTATSSDAQAENEFDEIFLEDDITPPETEPLSGIIPQISVTVPTETVILLGADGTCIAADSEIQNNSDVPVYLEQVVCAWKTNTQTSAEAIFTDWQEQKPYATLILDGGETHQFHPGENGTAVWEDINESYVIAAGEALELKWEFSLNENCVTEVLVAEKEAAVATVTYTVSSQAP